MDSWLPATRFTGYVFPNETDVLWGTLIVIYPYLTGLVAGAFIVSSFYHVFGMQQFRPVARFALLVALGFLLFTPLPLLFHLGSPERAFNAVWTPHLTSAMAAFGYVAGFYLVVLSLEIWFSFRADIVAKAKSTKGFLGIFYRVLTLGSYDVSERALAYDHKWGRGLAIIGIPSAVILHGYVGFVFGSLKARDWWSSDLMPVIFLLSAMVSGVAMLILLYVIVWRVRRIEIDENCLSGLARAMWGFLILALTLEALEFVNKIYKDHAGIETIWELVGGPLGFSLLILQVSIGSLIPFLILTALIGFKVSGKPFLTGVVVSALLILIGVLAMRWNVVIGGQELSKTMRGLLYFDAPFLGRESILTATLLFACPFVVLWVLTRLFPPWEPDERRIPVEG
ncbi:MAG: NrfD/PsrC family molybdoenzyme membrane anchor subunit [Gammaproteobacteria bacterium]